jgi:hypothetical protein
VTLYNLTREGAAGIKSCGCMRYKGRKRWRFVGAGQQFGLLTVVEAELPHTVHGARACRVRCACGDVRDKRIYELLDGLVTSCGCRGSTAAGLSAHYLKGTWGQMLRRCENPKEKQYAGYGGRGIKVCDRWHDFRLFVEDIELELGPRPEGRTVHGWPEFTLDRIDNDGNYEPGNLQWASRKRQTANTRTGLATRERRRLVWPLWQQGWTAHRIADELGEPRFSVRDDIRWFEERTELLSLRQELAVARERIAELESMLGV